MTPQRAQRRASWAMVAGVVAVAALVLSVWMVGDRAKANLLEESQRAVRQQTRQLRAGCARGVARDFESMGTNRDLRDFAQDAARARRAEGRVALAHRYRARASSAEFRMRRIRRRLRADAQRSVTTPISPSSRHSRSSTDAGMCTTCG
jgi:hypothetical protein